MDVPLPTLSGYIDDVIWLPGWLDFGVQEAFTNLSGSLLTIYDWMPAEQYMQVLGLW